MRRVCDHGRSVAVTTVDPPAVRDRPEAPVAPPHDVAQRTTGPRLPYLPALDGLRAVAVVAVLLYHSDLAGFRGGFLGVDVFFVLSGYLITCVLLAGRKPDGRLGLRTFWVRRARRLIPALLLVLLSTAAYTAVFVPSAAARLRGDLLGALTYVTNWQLLLGSESYFEAAGRPPMVQHLWSLAVEEQFYLVWPILLGVGLLVLRNHTAHVRRTRLAAGTLGAAIVSALLMSLQYDPLDPSRVYYGTDTHASGILVGAALGLVWAPWRLSTRTGRRAPLMLNAAGLAALAAVVWCFDNVSELDTGLYRGGYLLFALVVAVLVAVIAHPASRVVSTVLGWAPLRWIGARSYGIYLWHWPVYLVTRPRLDIGLTTVPLLALRVAITVTLASLSYRFVEMPIRDGALGTWRAALRSGRAEHGRRVAGRIAVAGGALAVSVALVGLGLAAADPAARPPGLDRTAVTIAVPPDPAPTTTTVAGVATTVPAPSTTAAPAAPPPPPPPHATVPVTAIGDSVLLGARGALGNAVGPQLQIDATVNRQFDDALAVVRVLRDGGLLGQRVILHLGNNGLIRPEQLDEMIGLLAAVPRVVVVNVSVPRPWEGPVNDVIRELPGRFPNVVVVDWKAETVNHPEYFVEDGVHLTNAGAAVYADRIARSL